MPQTSMRINGNMRVYKITITMVLAGLLSSAIYSNLGATKSTQLKQVISPLLSTFISAAPQPKPRPYAYLVDTNSRRTTCSMASSTTFAKPRTVSKKIAGNSQWEGPASISRTIGGPELDYFDPFIIFDFFKAKPRLGFHDHPHKGFETVTHVLQGESKHRDFAGHQGTIRANDVQWMTAGRGVVHSEWPAGVEDLIGFQLWINLAAKNKLMEPRYQELESKDIPRVQKDGVDVRIIAGESFGVRSPVFTITPTIYLDFTLQPGAQVHQSIPPSWNSCLFIVQGEGIFGSPNASAMPSNNLLVLSDGDGLSAWNKAAEPLRFVLIAGEPLNEPMAKQGPFVMNTQAELRQAMDDYKNCRNGFERAKNYDSKPDES